jgi:nucleoside-diphosphate-sugar epimerase
VWKRPFATVGYRRPVVDARRVLVTGAQGLLGRHVVARLLADPATERVVGVGRSPRLAAHYTHRLRWLDTTAAAPVPGNLRRAEADARYRYVPADVGSPAALGAVMADLVPDTVVHAAAALRDEAWADLYASNVGATFGLFDALGQAGVPAPRVVFVSSGSVYGLVDDPAGALDEGDACRPVDLYAASKRASEDVAHVRGREVGAPVTVARVFNLLGPGLQDRHLAADLAGQVAAIALGHRPPVVTTGPLTTTRDFVDVRDAAAGLVAMARAAAPPATVNVASGTETPVARLLEVLLELSGLTGVEHRIRPGRDADVLRSHASVARLRALGGPAGRSLEASLDDMLRYCVDLGSMLRE